MKLPKIQPLGRRSPVMIGVMGTAIVALVTVAAFQYDKLPFVKKTDDYAAYFSEAGGITTFSVMCPTTSSSITSTGRRYFSA